MKNKILYLFALLFFVTSNAQLDVTVVKKQKITQNIQDEAATKALVQSSTGLTNWRDWPTTPSYAQTLAVGNRAIIGIGSTQPFTLAMLTQQLVCTANTSFSFSGSVTYPDGGVFLILTQDKVVTIAASSTNKIVSNGTLVDTGTVTLPLHSNSILRKVFSTPNTWTLTFEQSNPSGGGGAVPTNTSELINDGDDGINPFISLIDLPSNLILYPTNVSSDIGGYSKLVSSITDPSFNTTAVDISTGVITGASQLIASLATSDNIIVGNPGVFNITTVGNIRKVSGSGTAEFFFRVYKRNAVGTETLILESSNTLPVGNGVYAEFSANGVWNDGIFLSTDRIVIKYYGTRIAGGSDPTYEFQFGGVAPVRTLVPIPLTVSPVNPSALISSDVSNVLVTGSDDKLYVPSTAFSQDLDETLLNGASSDIPILIEDVNSKGEVGVGYLQVQDKNTDAGVSIAPTGVEIWTQNQSLVAWMASDNISTTYKIQFPNKTGGTEETFAMVSDLTSLSGVYQPLDSDLTDISSLAPPNDNILQRKAGVWTSRTPGQFKTDLSLSSADVGLGNVDNTSDLNKPISTAVSTEYNSASALTFSGPIDLSKKGGSYYAEHTQTGAITFSVSATTVGGLAQVTIIANGNAINLVGGWINVGGEPVSTVNGTTNYMVVWQTNNKVFYSVKVY